MRRRHLLGILPAVGTAANGPDPPASGLSGIRRILVERLTGGETAAHLRDMITTAIHRSGIFAVTEDPEKADATLKGSAEDLVFTDKHYSRDSVQARVTLPVKTGSRGTPAASVGQAETMRSDERKHEATASVRLVNRSGDVIWSTTQESLGAKFRGASADVADKIVRQLKDDFEKERRKRSPPDPNPLPR